VSQNESIGRDSVQSIFHKIAKFKKKDWGMPKRLSIDEFSRRKGQGNLATIVTDLDKSSLLEVIDSQKSDDIITVLKQKPQSMREQVEEVSVDMWGGFQKVIKSVLPNYKVMIARFNVQKLVNKALTKFGYNWS
jgi:transposase